jgi:hypothetical protein
VLLDLRLDFHCLPDAERFILHRDVSNHASLAAWHAR